MLLIENENIYLREDIPLEEQAINNPAKLLQHENIEIFKTSKRFSQSHYKMILVDNKIALISTAYFNADTFDGTYRDFAVADFNPKDIAAIVRVFLADVSDQRIVPDTSHII